MIVGVSESGSGPEDEEDPKVDSSSGEGPPNDPLLSLANGFKRFMGTIDSLYRKYEELPGRVKVVFGIVTFFISIYFGRDIRNFTDWFVSSVLTPILGDLINFSFGIKIVLFLLVLLTIQVSIVNYRLNAIENNIGQQQMPPDKEHATDGGQQFYPDDSKSDDEIESSGAGVLGGAATGAAIGASFGPGGAVGGAILGAILGDEIEKSSARNRKKSEIKTQVVEMLLQKRILPPQAVHKRQILKWFPMRNEEIVEKAIEELVAKEDTPITKRQHDQISLTSVDEAVSYIRHNDGDVPFGFGEDGSPF